MATIIPVKQGSGDFAQLSPSGTSFSDFLLLGLAGTAAVDDLSSWLDVRRFWELGFQLFRPDFGVGLAGITVDIEGTNIVDPVAADPDISTPIIALGSLTAAAPYLEVVDSIRFVRAVLSAVPGAPITINIALHAQGR